MNITLKLARMGMNMQQATVAQWYKQPGDKFAKGDSLYSIETDKAVQDIDAPLSGTLIEVLVQVGEDVMVGHAVCIVDADLASEAV